MELLEEFEILLSDENILVDLIDNGTEKEFDKIKKLSGLYVPTPVLNKVLKSKSFKADLAGIKEYIPSFDLLCRASIVIGSFSPQDMMCLLICLENDWCCLTNDENLRSRCVKNGIKTVLGSDLL